MLLEKEDIAWISANKGALLSKATPKKTQALIVRKNLRSVPLISAFCFREVKTEDLAWVVGVSSTELKELLVGRIESLTQADIEPLFAAAGCYNRHVYTELTKHVGLNGAQLSRITHVLYAIIDSRFLQLEHKKSTGKRGTTALNRSCHPRLLDQVKQVIATLDACHRGSDTGEVLDQLGLPALLIAERFAAGTRKAVDALPADGLSPDRSPPASLASAGEGPSSHHSPAYDDLIVEETTPPHPTPASLAAADDVIAVDDTPSPIALTKTIGVQHSRVVPKCGFFAQIAKWKKKTIKGDGNCFGHCLWYLTHTKAATNREITDWRRELDEFRIEHTNVKSEIFQTDVEGQDPYEPTGDRGPDKWVWCSSDAFQVWAQWKKQPVIAVGEQFVTVFGVDGAAHHFMDVNIFVLCQLVGVQAVIEIKDDHGSLRYPSRDEMECDLLDDVEASIMNDLQDACVMKDMGKGPLSVYRCLQQIEDPDDSSERDSDWLDDLSQHADAMKRKTQIKYKITGIKRKKDPIQFLTTDAFTVWAVKQGTPLHTVRLTSRVVDATVCCLVVCEYRPDRTVVERFFDDTFEALKQYFKRVNVSQFILLTGKDNMLEGEHCLLKD